MQALALHRRATAAVLTLALGALSAAPARADGCSDCGPPADSVFREAMGALLRDYGAFPDYYETSGEECTVEVGAATQRKVGEEFLAVASGEAWWCPWGRSISQVRFQLALTSEYDWSLKSSVGAEFGAEVLAKVKASLESSTGGATGVGTVTEIRQTISAAWCHRLSWMAYFVIATYEASADYQVTRRFSWWIKNPLSGHHVIASGSVWHECEGGTAVVGRLWPVSATVATNDGACSGAACSGVVTFGPQFHPPLPDGLLGPVPPPPTLPEPLDEPQPPHEPSPAPDGSAPTTTEREGAAEPADPREPRPDEPRHPADEPLAPREGEAPSPAPEGEETAPGADPMDDATAQGREGDEAGEAPQAPTTASDPLPGMCGQ